MHALNSIVEDFTWRIVMHMRINVFVVLALAAVALTPHRAMARNRHGCDRGIASKKKRERHGGLSQEPSICSLCPGVQPDSRINSGEEQTGEKQ